MPHIQCHNWTIVLSFEGIGYAVVLIAFYVDFYYNVIIAWALRFFFASFTDFLPWTTCDNPWNTPKCRPVSGNRAILELHRSEGLHDLGSIKWDMALCLFVVYVICYFSLWKGISTSGK
ncbi:unnamed protein product, partial [Nesidiocoris tenuis]